MAIQNIAQPGTLDSGSVKHVLNIEVNIDKDLVELAGKHAYKHPKDDVFIDINGNEYEILDFQYGTETGLDAFTLKNVNDKNNENLIIVYVGSEQIIQDWLLTNGKLPSDLSPEQMFN